MNKSDLVSIIVPVYNAEVLLGRCVNSILNQTYSNIEVILINDGSIDSSGEICDLFFKKDSRVRVLHQENAGVSAARNKGIDAAHGRFIQFIDADDYIENIMVESLLNQMRKNVDLVMCGYKRIYMDNQGREEIINSDIYSEVKMLKKDFMSKFGIYFTDYYVNYIWNKLYRTNIIKSNNMFFDKSIGWGEDLIFNLSYINCCNKLSIIPDLLYNYVNYNEDSITSNFNVNLYKNQQSMYTSLREFLISNDSYYGVNKDLVETRYTNSIVACINNLFHKDAGYSSKKIRKEINSIFGNKHVIRNIEYFKYGTYQKRIIGRMIKNNQVNSIIYYFRIKVFAKNRLGFIYQILKEFNSLGQKE